MGRLGYQRYGAQVGDWGATVTTALAIRHPEPLAGIRLNMVTAFPDRAARASHGDLTPQEQAALASGSASPPCTTGTSWIRAVTSPRSSSRRRS